MAAPKKRRWVCPLGCGNNVMAPGRMRKNNALRYCLDCTAKTGKLVERTCPALDRKRNSAAQKRKQREAQNRKEQRERDRRRYVLWCGTDLRDLLRQARKLKAWARESARCARAVERCRADVRVKNVQHYRGTATARSITVSCRRDTHPATAMAIIVHELTHVACDARGGERGHGRVFWSLWLDAMGEVLPALRSRDAELFALRDAALASERWKTLRLGHYALEWATEDLMRELWDEQDPEGAAERIDRRDEQTAIRHAVIEEARERIAANKHKSGCALVQARGRYEATCDCREGEV